jgi:hypothetical protein
VYANKAISEVLTLKGILQISDLEQVKYFLDFKAGKVSKMKQSWHNFPSENNWGRRIEPLESVER